MDNPSRGHKKVAKPLAHEHANSKLQTHQDQVKSTEQIKAVIKHPLFTDQDTGDKYTNQGFLGMGGYGIVVKVVNNLGEYRAMKVPKPTTRASAIKQEIDMLILAGKHRRLVEFQGAANTEYGTSLMFELLLPKTLSSLMKTRVVLSEPEVRWFIPKIAEGINHLNSQGLGHCDLKPGNILLASDMTPKLADLGLSARLSPGAKKVWGTPGYVAPEVFGTSLTIQMDIFSLGIIVFMMLKGHNPKLTDETQAYETRLAPLLDDQALSQLAVKLLERLLAFDPKKRMKVDEIKDDPFFTSGVCPNELSQEAFNRVPNFPLLGKHIQDDDDDENDEDDDDARESCEAHGRPKFKKFRAQPPPATGAKDEGEAWRDNEAKNGSKVKDDSSANEDGQCKDEGAAENQMSVPKKNTTGVESLLADIQRTVQSSLKKANSAEIVKQQRQEYEERKRADKEAIRAGYGDVDDEFVDMAVLVYSATPDDNAPLSKDPRCT
ncbi:MAG: kinase-like domain-containing protein [Linnemannia gamsii]|nr:MAG: kinase-like domain-containing protein [Linnemannia gamsii]